MADRLHQGGDGTGLDAVASIVSARGAGAGLLRDLLGVQARIGGALAGVILKVVGTDRVDAVCEWSGPDAPPDAAAWMGPCAEIVGAWTPGSARTAIDPLGDGWVVVVPLAVLGEAGAAAAFVLGRCDRAEAEARANRLELAVVSLWAHRVRSERDREGPGPARVRSAVEIAAVASRGATLREVGATLVHELGAALGAERVMLGIVRGGAHGWVRLESVSGVERVKRSMGIVAPAEAAMEECADQDQEIVVPEDADATVISREHRALAAHLGGRCLASLPVRSADADDPIVGVVTIERVAESPIGLDELAMARLAVDLVSARVAECRSRSGWVGARVTRWARRGAARLVGPDHALAKVIGILVGVALIASVVVRMPERIAAPAEIVPVDRRVCVAPAEGAIVSIGVHAGDRVTAGETVLGVLDDSDARLELAEARAQAAAFEQSESAARGKGETADARIAHAQREEAEARIRLLEDRIARMRIVAPIDGVVIRAPEDATVGTVVRFGDALFEVASEDGLRFEARAPVRWIDRISTGTRGWVTAASAPGQSFEVAVDRVEPVVRTEKDEVGGDRFRVSGEIRGDADPLHIGMRGVVRLEVGRAPVGVIWTRAIGDAIRAWGWW